MNALEEKIKEIADHVRSQVSALLFDVESDVLPYIDEDTAMNAAIQAQDIVKNILSGNFIFDGDHIVVNNTREFAPRVRFAFTSLDYDNLRDKIIERMPKCPKDAKIAALESQLKQSYDTLLNKR